MDIRKDSMNLVVAAVFLLLVLVIFALSLCGCSKKTTEKNNISAAYIENACFWFFAVAIEDRLFEKLG